MVQAGHACLEAGHRFAQPPTPSHLVVLAVASERALLNAVARSEVRGVRFYVFYEPDGVEGYTAACTEPLGVDRRGTLSRYPLWGASLTRGPPASRQR